MIAADVQSLRGDVVMRDMFGVCFYTDAAPERFRFPTAPPQALLPVLENSAKELA